MSSHKQKNLQTLSLAERLSALESEQEARSSALEEHGSGFRHNQKKSKAKRRLDLDSLKRKRGAGGGGDNDESDGSGDEQRGREQDNESGRKRKKHKNAPAELPSNKPVRRLRVTADNTNKKEQFHDPRFLEYTGKLDESKFHSAYSFLDAYQEDEIKGLSKASKKMKSENKKQVTTDNYI